MRSSLRRLNPDAHTFLRAVALHFPEALCDNLVSLFEEVTPPATTWALELRSTGCRLAIDCCFAMAKGAELVPMLWEAHSRKLVDEIAGQGRDGRWFFEVDTSAGDATIHSFARLRPHFRNGRQFIEGAESRSDSFLTKSLRAVAKFVKSTPPDTEVSDVGVVIRAGGAELRLGVKSPCGGILGLVERAEASEPVLDALRALVPNIVSPHRCTLQLAAPACGGSAVFSGVEIAAANQNVGWEPVLSSFVVKGWLGPDVARRALRWRGREILSTTNGRWPRVLAREISHAKLVSHGPDGIKAKLYVVGAEALGPLV